jgi:hypothetical protein
LGILDEQLARCGPEGFFRKFYGVQGRTTHEKINPFERGSAGARRLDARAVDPKLGFEVAFEHQNGAFRQLRQIVFVEKSGRAHHLPIRDGTTPEQLLAAYKGLGVTAPFDTHVFFDPEEQPWVEALIRATWPSVTLGKSSLSSTNYEELVVNFELTERYFRAIAKIGFHYFLTQFPRYYGDEPMFSSLHQYILDGGGGIDRANEFIGLRQTPLLGEMLDPKARPDGWQAHVLCCEIRPGVCCAYLQMFLSEDWPPPIYAINLANDPDISLTEAFGHAYIYFTGGAKGKYCGEVHSLATTRAEFPPVRPSPVVT